MNINFPPFRFLDMHMYVTSALQRTDMKAVGLQLALDLLHEKVGGSRPNHTIIYHTIPYHNIPYHTKPYYTTPNNCL